MEILKEYYCLYQNYYETSNSYQNVCLLKIVVLFYSSHENHLQTIFLSKNIAYLLSYFSSQHFLNPPFYSHCAMFNFYLFPMPNKVLLYFIQKINCIIMEFIN